MGLKLTQRVFCAIFWDRYGYGTHSGVISVKIRRGWMRCR